MALEDSLKKTSRYGLPSSYSVEEVKVGNFTGVLKTYPGYPGRENFFEVFTIDQSSPFSIFEEGITSREEALATLERQVRQYRDELQEKVDALNEILAGPSGKKTLLERVSEEGGLHDG